MKKLKLSALELGTNEVLSRSQMKNVMGGIYEVDDVAANCGVGCVGSCVGRGRVCFGKPGSCMSKPSGGCVCAVICAG